MLSEAKLSCSASLHKLIYTALCMPRKLANFGTPRNSNFGKIANFATIAMIFRTELHLLKATRHTLFLSYLNTHFGQNFTL